MPPYESTRRFDPYGGQSNTTTNQQTHHASTIRQQRVLVGGAGVRSRRGSGPDTSPYASTASSGVAVLPPGRGGSLSNRRTNYGHQTNAGASIDRILGSNSHQLHQKHHEPIDASGHYNGENSHYKRNHRVGAANLSSQVHPLLAGKRRRPQSSHQYDHDDFYKDKPYRGGRGNSYPQRSPLARLSNILNQTHRILSLLLGQIPEEDIIALQKQQHYGMHDNEEEILLKLLSAKSSVRIVRLFLLLPLLLYTSKRLMPPLANRITRPKAWSWSAGVEFPGQKLQHRNLGGRQCVMNYFIEKQPPDEYDPDFVEIKPDEIDSKTGKPKVAPPVKIIEGSYRTKGQVHVISRFIEAVADSFRSNTSIRQHLIFAETRDSGHLAYEAMRHWPPRGKHRTMVHVLASNDLPSEKDAMVAAKALGYGSLEDIEERFKGVDKARVYDREGNMAGLPNEEGVDDDDALNEMDMEIPDKETLELRVRSGRKRRMNAVNTTLLSDGTRYPNLRALLPFEEEDDGEGEVVVPYLHVDGVSMTKQLQVLESARTLLEDKTIVAVGIEHSPDMDVRRLIAFFQEVKYKTFFLGARQVARIDNLCEEVLQDVLEHPSVAPPKGNWFRRLFIHLNLIPKDELRIAGDKTTPEGPKRRETPPFFVAMPRGRRSKEEMTIQHMYDLFGGYGGGGGQIKTANDRKAPGK
ncbi:predicted protein [Thalassiosira pseudonana CCMP1335]|uniref:Uncharacterized protein n=1 Tax=Thalassiosira pseudonana TaxID=35128 RepID=B8LBS4_THAPS|nr:predicted protein [Thalassiosira pseudonana CCMP1335]EED87232.1 predicted protein [Thalassiosira pseudonana CCMP1335]